MKKYTQAELNRDFQSMKEERKSSRREAFLERFPLEAKIWRKALRESGATFGPFPFTLRGKAIKLRQSLYQYRKLLALHAPGEAIELMKYIIRLTPDIAKKSELLGNEKTYIEILLKERSDEQMLEILGLGEEAPEALPPEEEEGGEGGEFIELEDVPLEDIKEEQRRFMEAEDEEMGGIQNPFASPEDAPIKKD